MGVRDRDPVHPPHDSCPTIHTSQNSSQGDPRVWLRGVDSGGPHGGNRGPRSHMRWVPRCQGPFLSSRHASYISSLFIGWHARREKKRGTLTLGHCLSLTYVYNRLLASQPFWSFLWLATRAVRTPATSPPNRILLVFSVTANKIRVGEVGVGARDPPGTFLPGS